MLGSLDEVDPEILRIYEKLGIPLAEQEVLAGVEGARKVAVDAVFDSVSVATSFREELLRAGVIFLSISEAIREYPDLVSFLIGCSFTFETPMMEAGIDIRHITDKSNVPMYLTNRACRPAGRLQGNLVVSMRPIPAGRVADAR